MSFSSLIVQREIATIREVEEALARQVLYGGDLVTNLFEVTRLDEAKVTPLLAESYGLAPAPIGELPAPIDGSKTLVPVELATARAMVPLAKRGDKIVLAVSEPLAKDAEEELAFALGLGLEQRVAPSFRVRQAISREYGVPLERRVLRLLGRLGGSMASSIPAEPHGTIPPLLDELPKQAEPRPPLNAQVTPHFGLPLPTADGPRRHDTISGMPPAPDSVAEGARGVPRAPRAPAIASHSEPPPTEVAPARHPTSPMAPPSVAPARDAAPPAARVPTVTQKMASVKPPPPVAAAGVRTQTQKMAAPAVAPPSGTPRATLQRDPPNAPSGAPAGGKSRRRRGPLTPDSARVELDEASDRDQILNLFFDFSRQYFDYSALFLVQSDIAEGRDAFGDGAGRERVAKIGVPLDLPSLLARARDAKNAIVGVPSNEGLDRVLVGDLDRAALGPVLVVPLVVRARVVALLYGDSGEAGVDDVAVKEVSELAHEVGDAFERLIVRKKRGGSKAGKSGPPGAGADAAKASSPSDEATHAAPPATVLSPRAHSMPPPSNAPPPVVEPAIVPPPANLFQVRKPAGRPIPREEPQPHEEEDETDPHLVVPPVEGPPPTTVDVRVQALKNRERDGVDASVIVDVGAPASQAISVPARRPPSARSTPVEGLPSVIVDVGLELNELVERVLTGRDEHAEAELLRQGQTAMPAIMERFPGPIRADAERLNAITAGGPLKEPVLRASECGPLLHLIAGQRRVALPFVLPKLDDPDAQHRFWATFLLHELAYGEAAPAVVARLFDDDPGTRQIARLAARAIAENHPAEMVQPLADIALAGLEATVKRVATIEVLGDLREPAAVPVLASLLQDGEDVVVEAAHQALTVVTRQDFGDDPRKWQSWWSAHSSQHRVEWLIDALGHDDLKIRHAAGEELKAITKEYFGYYGDLQKRERDRAQQRYRDWWQTEGRGRFRRT